MQIEIDKYERQYLILAVAMLGLFFAALITGVVVFGVRTPDAGAFINPLALNDTEFAQPGLREMGDGRYEAYIVAQMWQFNTGSAEKDARGHDLLRVPVGSEVTFNVTSRDVTHGFLIERHNVNIEVVPGHVGRQTVTFDEPGTYYAICHEYCGRNHHNMVFAIVVE